MDNFENVYILIFFIMTLCRSLVSRYKSFARIQYI